MTEQTALVTISPNDRLTLEQITRHIQLNKQSGWGLEKGSPAQLNQVALYCEKHNLLPGDDVTLYEGKQWITVDGRIKLMVRHPHYRGHSTRALTKDEKDAWGYDSEDLVVEATIRHAVYGEIKARGKVSKAERTGTFVQGTRNNPVAKHHPVEMAEKRALSRAERVTFGMEAFVDDGDVEAAVTTIIEERTDPARVALNAARYDQVFGTDEERDTASDVPTTRASDFGASNEDANPEDAGEPIAVGPQYRCVSCLGLVLDQRNNQPINESQAGAIVERFGELVCRSCRPKERTA